VAAPVFDEEGQVQGSLTIAIPITRLDRHEVAMIQAVRACADAASDPATRARRNLA
jgi:DNA-binding IclR family transcriptional regulator